LPPGAAGAVAAAAAGGAADGGATNKSRAMDIVGRKRESGSSVSDSESSESVSMSSGPAMNSGRHGTDHTDLESFNGCLSVDTHTHTTVRELNERHVTTRRDATRRDVRRQDVTRADVVTRHMLLDGDAARHIQ
jgi:hypothetical protein